MGRTPTFRDAGALVTGASSGIGAEVALCLARQGARLVLTARRADRLEATAARCRAEGSPEVHVVADDLADPAAPARIADRATALLRGVDVVVANAGFAVPGLFEAASLERTHAMLRVNVAAPTDLVRRLLPPMLERRRGYVMVVASLAGLLPAPYQAAYAGTKAYLVNWSESLRQEVAARGVRVTALCPGVTDTEFFEAAGYRNVTKYLKHKMAADRVARRGVAGLARGRPCVVPGFVNRLLLFVGARLSPRRFTAWVSKKLMGARPPPVRP